MSVGIIIEHGTKLALAEPAGGDEGLSFPIVELTSRYAIAQVPPRFAAGGHVIMCKLCKRVSANPNDVEERYCGHCREFLCDVRLPLIRNGVQ